MITTGTEVVVARYGELWLKGKNRGEFERRLMANVRQALEPLVACELQRATGVLIVRPAARVGDVARRLQEVFGFSSISPALAVERGPQADEVSAEELEEIVAASRAMLERALESSPVSTTLRFRVETKRADKRFGLTSTELDRHVADRVLPAHSDRLRVDLSRPELTLGIYVRPECTYVFAERLPGGGGLPVGCLGKVTCLLSGGIDSPVAAYLAMKRGCEVSFAAFHSYPFIGESYLAKVRRLVRSLGRYQPSSVLFEVPFADVQTAIRDRCPPSYRTVLYRRMMQRIATVLAERARATALVTGESLGQVASQTLENMTCIGAASGLPVLRPLVTYDKVETIEVARRIGTYELSIEPEPDCCTVFQPKRPIIRGRLEVCEDAERELEVEALVAAAVAGTERVVVG